MKRLLFAILILSVCTPVFAQNACMIEAKKLDDIDGLFTEMGCKKGDYFTVYSYSVKKRRQLRIRAVMMKLCDLSKPFSVEASSAGGNRIFGTCTLSGENRKLILGKEAKKDMH